MPRYIDADKMIDGYCTTFPYNIEYCDDGDLMEWINAQPTVNVVEVVRCKDCKHWRYTCTDPIIDYDYGICLCDQWEYQNEFPNTTSKDFCSYGEKKEGAK